MGRVVLYIVTSYGVVPIRKSYKKARYKRQMGRFHDWHGFQKKGR
jgi:hypothetical protein